MDHKFTEQLHKWLATPKDERDYEQGALFLLKLSGNRIMYRNLVANPGARADFIEYQIQKYYNFRVKDLTHTQVQEMTAKVEKIVSETLSDESSEKKQKGKRDDHESLPDEIKAKYVENLSILHRMREVHLRLRTMSLESATCPDSERYPYLKELIDLDKRMHANWFDYDNYVVNKTVTKKTKATATKKTTSTTKKAAASTKKNATTPKKTAKKSTK